MHYSRAVDLSSAGASRSDASQRAEDARREWSEAPASQHPLVLAARDAAADLDVVLYEAWCEGDARASNVCVAQALGCDEKQVRQYRDGRKRLPVAAVYAMPAWLAERLLARVSRRLRAGDRDGAALVRRGLDMLARAVTRENASELRRLVREAQKALLELDARIDEVQR